MPLQQNSQHIQSKKIIPQSNVKPRKGKPRIFPKIKQELCHKFGHALSYKQVPVTQLRQLFKRLSLQEGGTYFSISFSFNLPHIYIGFMHSLLPSLYKGPINFGWPQKLHQDELDSICISISYQMKQWIISVTIQKRPRVTYAINYRSLSFDLSCDIILQYLYSPPPTSSSYAYLLGAWPLPQTSDHYLDLTHPNYHAYPHLDCMHYHDTSLIKGCSQQGRPISHQGMPLARICSPQKS